MKICIVLFSKYVSFLGYGKDGFNHKPCSFFTSFFRLIITLGFSVFGVKILKIAWIILSWQPFCKSAYKKWKYYLIKRTNLELGKFLLCYIFTVAILLSLLLSLPLFYCRKLTAFFFTTCFEFSCSLFTFESLHNGGTLYYVIFPYYRGTVYSL